MKTWEEMSEREQLECNHYELYKDVNGFRPRHIDYSKMSDAELKADFDFLVERLAEVQAEEAAREAAAVKEFEELVQHTIEAGARTRENAIKWLFEAENDPYVFADPDYYCHSHGLPYGYFNKEAA